jgi:hypothetical protein
MIIVIIFFVINYGIINYFSFRIFEISFLKLSGLPHNESPQESIEANIAFKSRLSLLFHRPTRYCSSVRKVLKNL